MAEAEDVITDAARHATIYAQQLWRRHRPPLPGPPVLQLADIAARLDLLITAALGPGLVLRPAQPPAPPTFLSRWLQRGEPPQPAQALPATDGFSLWLPPALPAEDGVEAAAERYRTLALAHAQRALRGTAQQAAGVREPLAHALLTLLEAHAADHALVLQLPGMAGPLARLRATALASRPRPAALPAHLRPLEALVQAALAAPPGGSVLLAAAGLAAEGGELLLRLPASPAEVRERALQLAERLRPADAPARQQRWCVADAWLGELRAPPAAAALLGSADEGPPEAEAAPARSARLPRRPQVRDKQDDEDDEGGPPGAWMVQTAQPHEQAADPMGLQRPTDRDTDTAAEEFADALSELPEARLVRTPGRPKEVLLSDDPPEHLARQSQAGGADPGSAAERSRSYPEWDWRSASYRPDGATVLLREAAPGAPQWLAVTLEERRGMLHEVRRRFELLRSRRIPVRRQLEGDDIDLEAWTEARADFRAGLPLPQRLYRSERRQHRDLAVLVLIDVSGSTDAWIAPGRRVIDVAREALLLVALALDGMGSPFAVQAFSGEGPHGVVVREVKGFGEAYGPEVALRIAGLEPEHYTRAGAALRHATSTLMRETAAQRLLLLLSDGKPNDTDQYEGRYGLEDMRQAVTEARLQGISPFCLTIDRHAASYLPAVFGAHHYALLPQPERLPQVLLEWLRRLVAQ
ncbi:nitric oxide reductase NorD protein [Melaminivora alkalimesophila]|uniref:Nitric oxide reductase NorD protein n=2 Tax=Melaminivora alkalimesophila TaxID=1165852 RepID=A0A317RDS1_9BURK|nr:VWA domain-containing protein [Melaminivora alkalimesophila]PWW47713.1 nitric oxide reductase NorD protein [Melaminivora alkalimesophila]